MKRQILTLGAICAAAFTLTNCNKEIAEPKAPVTEGIPFEIVAATADTKTANDGLNTVWTTGDALNVFHAEAGSTAYGNNDKFTYAGADNKFKGTLKTALEVGGGKSYDWYALYPVNSNAKYVITTPAGSKDDDGWAYIGNKGGATQNGYNSKAHLAETLCPLYGVAKSVDASTPVSFNMKHIASVVKIVVTNESESPLTVTSVTFTAPEDIVGSYYMNFTDPNNVVCTASGTSYVSKTATLNVTGGTALAKGEKAEFYIPIKPFKAAANNLKITVNGYEKTPASTADVEFKAGKIEAVNFKYDKAIAAETLVAKFVAKSIGSGYAAHENVSSNGKNWTVTFGQGTYVGTNKDKKANCKLGTKYEKVGTPCGYTATQTQVAAIISESALANVSKVVVNGDTDTNNPEKISLVYSTDGTTYSLVETKTYSKAGNEFTFTKIANAYYAVVLYYSSSSGFMRTNKLVVSFYE